MSINRKEQFRENISKHLRNKLDELEIKFGKDSKEYLSIANQYIYNPLEDTSNGPEVDLKHYEAGAGSVIPHNLERLYKRHCCIEVTFSCCANCRFCLRSNYERFSLSDENIEQISKYLLDIDAKEVLITGGDPFCAPVKLSQLVYSIVKNAPNVQIFRIATRMITQAPELISEKVFNLLESLSKQKKVEVATQINSAYELKDDDDVKRVVKKIQSYGITIYSQNVFLKGVNDTPEQLIDLYNEIRMLGIEPHYLFLSCPIVGTHHHRPSIETYDKCYSALVNSGAITGRSKPIMAFMTEIGKITITLSSVIQYKKGEYIELKSDYKYEDRLKYNPDWKLPDNAYVNDEGYLCVRYLDGED